MQVLGINPGHNGTAALLKDGKVIACVSEERFSRLKNHVGFPHESVKYCLNFAGIEGKDLDYVILSTTSEDLSKKGRTYDIFHQLYSTKNFVKKTFGYLTYKFPTLTNPIINFKHNLYNKKNKMKTIENNKREMSQYFNVSPDKIICIDHHLSHALSTCFNLPKDEKTLIFTLDGEGDFLCATVNIFDGEKVKRIATSPKAASLGYLYAIATLYLGMKPNQHEFKVMGMAPYAKKDKVEKLLPMFKEIIWIDNFKWDSKFRMQYADSFMLEKMKYQRFDVISGAIQKLSEDLIVEWIKNSIKKTGIKNVALAGGVMMNVKACQKVYEMEDVENLFIVPSAGDESTSIGACFYGYEKCCAENNKNFNPKPIEELYLGPKYDEKYIKKMIRIENISEKYKITKEKNINEKVASLLAKGEIVARCSERSEFGARALGNRSILANPCDKKTIKILNETIKDRDFWMPFTPSMLDKFEKKYIVNPKKMFAPYMLITFEATEKAKKDLPAAMHPYDETTRPQIVTKKFNPEYYDLIERFSKKTGIGALLNTSFNLHGEPNVLTPEDAIHTVENSDLKFLAIGDYLFEKKLI